MWNFKPLRSYHRNGDVVTWVFRGKRFLKVGNQEYQSDDWANLTKILLEVARSRK